MEIRRAQLPAVLLGNLLDHIMHVLALVGVVLRALVALFEREARVAVRKALLLRGGEGNVGA